jgi:hypothetical protein
MTAPILPIINRKKEHETSPKTQTNMHDMLMSKHNVHTVMPIEYDDALEKKHAYRIRRRIGKKANSYDYHNHHHVPHKT